jgi:hypothetical protein
MTIARGSEEPRVALQIVHGPGAKPGHNGRRTHMEPSHVAALNAKHQGLEARIKEELNRPAPDMAIIQLLKKQKLRLKEALTH